MKKCTVCSNELPGHRQRFCSDRCSSIHGAEVVSRRRKRLQLDPIICGTCGKSFVPISIRNKFCSKDCWTVVQVRRKAAKRRLLAEVPSEEEKDATKRFYPIWKAPVFGERMVTEAKFTKADTDERKELQAAVEEYLSKGGRITRYGDQIGKTLLELEGKLKWEISKAEQKDIEDELARTYGIDECT